MGTNHLSNGNGMSVEYYTQSYPEWETGALQSKGVSRLAFAVTGLMDFYKEPMVREMFPSGLAQI